MTQKRYTMHLSSKQTVLLDQEDFDKFLEKGEKGSLVKLKQAIINPSFVVAIVPFNEKEQVQVEGHVDEDTGKYIITAEKPIIPSLPDGFVKDDSLLA